jgi:hypothetical protein
VYCELKKEIGGNRSGDSWISYCGAGQPSPRDADTCIGGRTPNYTSSWPIMHNKFYLFSRTHGKSSVVVQTTSNLSSSSGPKMFNSAVAIAGKPELYKVYQDYFADLAEEEKEPEYYEQNKPDRIDGQLEVNFSPRQNGNTPLNDEIWLMIIDDEVHDAFRQNFWDIRKCANLVWQASSPERYWGTPTRPHKDCLKTR